jgi:hypothetical protein
MDIHLPFDRQQESVICHRVDSRSHQASGWLIHDFAGLLDGSLHLKAAGI